MKRKTAATKLRELRKSIQVLRSRRRLNKAKRRSARRNLAKISPMSQPGILVAPPHFIILCKSGQKSNTDIDAYFSFLEKLRETKYPALMIDLSGVRRMVADAALLFKAELSTLIEVRKIIVTAIAPRSDRTKQVLKQTGMDTLLGIRIEENPNREDVVHWRIAEGPRSTLDPSTLTGMMEDIESVTGMIAHPVYQGIIESMANCVEHAYKEHREVTREFPKSPGWWVFQQVKDEILHVVVCDLGIGVRRSLPLTLTGESGLYKKLMHLARRAKGQDNRALLAAMEYGRSSTGQRQRGKGMRNAHKVVDDLGEGTFCAISNAGCYVYSRRPNGPSPSVHTTKLRYSINGTILGWQVPLKRSNTEGLP